MNNLISDIPYESGMGNNRSFRIAWRKSFDLVYISFYDEDKKVLLFEDELSLTSATELRDKLSKIIEIEAK